MNNIDPEQLGFVRGILVGLASSGQVIVEDELERLCQLSREQARRYVDAAGEYQDEDEPDVRAIVVNQNGAPTARARRLEHWPAALRAAHEYWTERRGSDDERFRRKWGGLPTLPLVRRAR